MVWRPARRKGRAQRWASVTAEPRAPLAGSSTGGSTSTTWRSRPAHRCGRRDLDRPPDERLRQLARVPDRRRAADDDRLDAVVGADPKQPAQDVGDVATEHAPVRVQLVDDDVAQLFEQLEPLGVVGQDRRVEHVRVGDHDLAGGADGRPDRRRRVPVVGRCRDAQAGGRATARRTRPPGPGRAPWSGRGGVRGRPGPRRSPAGSAARSTATCPRRSA